MAITMQERVRIAINQLTSGDTDYLYRFIEEAGRGTIQATLRDDYSRIVTLYDHDATLTKLLKALKREAGKSTTKRIDLLIMLHGHPGELVFKDGRKLSSEVGAEITALSIKSKLRLAYNTSCYGDSHSLDLLAAGFDAAIGSRRVNANAAVEFAPLLSLWQFDVRLAECLAPTRPPTSAADAIATQYGQSTNASWKDDVDSRKRIRGNADLKIST